MSNTLPPGTIPCPDCNATGNVCKYHVPDDATVPAFCPTCKGHGYVKADRIPVRSAADDLRELLTDIRNLLWRYREFCPEAVDLHIRVGEALDLLEDVREVKVR
jgi:hypothetical protein